MKKIIIGLCASGLIFASAEMVEVEKGFSQGIGVGYAQVISMENPSFKIDDSQKLCSEKINADVNMNKRGQESFAIAVNECVSQLKNIRANRK
jgi:hypothetical protein